MWGRVSMVALALSLVVIPHYHGQVLRTFTLSAQGYLTLPSRSVCLAAYQVNGCHSCVML